jgi:hypothetical protein
MANNIIFTDGFDHYSSIADKWDLLLASANIAVSPPAIVPGVGRGGAGALFVGSGVKGSIISIGAQKNVGSQTTLYVGFALNWNPAVQDSDMAVMYFMDGSTCQVALCITNSGVLYFNKGSLGSTPVVIGTRAAVSLAANSFHYIEVQVTISSTVGVCQLKMDQVSVLNLTGVNTQVSGNASFSSVRMGVMVDAIVGETAYTAYLDDIYFDTLGFNGDVRINGQLPSGNGTTQNFTNVEAGWVASTVTVVPTTIIDSNSNLQQAIATTSDFKTGSSAPTWATSTGVNTTDNHVTWVCLGAVSQYKLVNESNPDGDSSYIKDSTVGDISRFTFPAITGSTIKTVMVWAFAKKDDGGLRSIQASMKSGATVGTSGTDVPLGGNYQYLLMQCPTDPNTSAAWTAAGVNAAEFGVKLTS